jgi:hypothetical protein
MNDLVECNIILIEKFGKRKCHVIPNNRKQELVNFLEENPSADDRFAIAKLQTFDAFLNNLALTFKNMDDIKQKHFDELLFTKFKIHEMIELQLKPVCVMFDCTYPAKEVFSKNSLKIPKQKIIQQIRFMTTTGQIVSFNMLDNSRSKDLYSLQDWQTKTVRIYHQEVNLYHSLGVLT